MAYQIPPLFHFALLKIEHLRLWARRDVKVAGLWEAMVSQRGVVERDMCKTGLMHGKSVLLICMLIIFRRRTLAAGDAVDSVPAVFRQSALLCVKRRFGIEFHRLP